MKTKEDIFDHLNRKEIPTPDTNYFDQLAKDVVSTQKPKIIPLYRKPIAWIGTAAAVIALVFLLNPRANTELDVLLALNDIPTEDVFSYIDENIDEFDTDLISEILEEENIGPIEFMGEEITPAFNGESENLNLEDIDTEEILEYLENEAIDFDEDDELIF